jgi:hypothetical protein
MEIFLLFHCGTAEDMVFRVPFFYESLKIKSKPIVHC